MRHGNQTLMTDDLIGKQIGGYEVQEMIGLGGMATVYRAQQVSMKRAVAIKVLPRQFVEDDTYMQRFNREVEIVAKLEHRNIVPVHDYGEYNGLPYIVMRYMPAGSVDDLLASGPLPLEKALRIIEQIAPALDYAHSKGIYHRDLKPSNILMDDNEDAYLTDFGIARIVGEAPGATITQQGVVGTPSYMSPEQAQGHALDHRSDIYSLGITLFEMVTGQRPFQSDTPYSIAVMQVTTPPPAPRSINRSIPVPVEQVILKVLRKHPDERYDSAAALSTALRMAMDPVADVSAHDTQPGMARPPEAIVHAAPVNHPAPVQRPVQPAPVAQQQIAARPTAQPVQPTGYMAAAAPVKGRVRAQKPKKPRSLWMNAALGGIIGCGLLALLVAILAVIIAAFDPAGTASAVNNVPTQVPLIEYHPDNGLVPTLDPVSDAARNALLGNGNNGDNENNDSPQLIAEPTAEEPAPIATAAPFSFEAVTDASPAEEATIPTFAPVGER
jgi:tRNA A-37 threonylcarbamoyl transferase component Bud32